MKSDTFYVIHALFRRQVFMVEPKHVALQSISEDSMGTGDPHTGRCIECTKGKPLL